MEEINYNVSEQQSNNGAAASYNFKEKKAEVTKFVSDEQEIDYLASEEQSNEVDPLLHFNEEKPEEMVFVSDEQEINRIDLFDNDEIGNEKKMYLPNKESVKMEMEPATGNKKEFEELNLHEEIEIKDEDEGELERSDEKLFVCNVCGYKATRKMALKRHLVTHTRERSFACNLCDYRTTQAAYLKQHKMKHREKPFAEVHPNMTANNVSVLIKTNFGRLSLEDKLKIKDLGRPLPDLNLTQVSERKTQNRTLTFTRRFSRDIYSRNNWICGCEVSNMLYCFPCILFDNSAQKGADPNWSRYGIKDLHHLPAKVRKHESSSRHINACIQLALLGNINIMTQLNPGYRKQINEHNKLVRKNRYILKRIIYCVKFCGAFELPFRGQHENDESRNPGVFKKLIDFSAELDLILREHLENATIFKGTSKTIQNDILDSMLAVCKEEIYSQIKNSDFLAIQCDETTDVTNWCQMVLIFRYIFDGTLCERFWCFKRIQDKSAIGIQKCIEEEIDPIIIETPHKLIAQTYDGANVMSGAIGEVQTHIKKKYPYAHYTHAHQLNLLIQTAASQHAKVRVFFSNLSAIPAFFSNSSHRCDVLEEIIKRRLPKVAVTRWNYNIRTVNAVYENREKLIEVFEEIEENCLRNTTSNEASSHRRALEDPEFMFWLSFFHKILPHVDVLYNKIQSRNKDSRQLQRDIQTFETCVRYIRNETEIIQHNIEEHFHSTKRRRKEDNLSRSVHAKEVCDVIISQMNNKFSYRGHLEAAELFNSISMPEFSKRFPINILATVCSAYPFLDKARLKTELEVIYSRPDFIQIVGATNFLSLLLQHNLSETFPETVKLLKIILTTPMTTAESERCFSTLKRVKTFLRNTMTNDRLNALAMICINKDLIEGIDNFDEKVLEKFISLENRTFELTFKK